MNIVNAFKLFGKTVTGKEPAGHNIADVIRDAASNMVTSTDDGKAIVLKSSTASSTKSYKITVVDGGTISATEITEVATVSDDPDESGSLPEEETP